jgi:hypothetical protein
VRIGLAIVQDRSDVSGLHAPPLAEADGSPPCEPTDAKNAIGAPLSGSRMIFGRS